MLQGHAHRPIRAPAALGGCADRRLGARCARRLMNFDALFGACASLFLGDAAPGFVSQWRKERAAVKDMSSPMCRVVRGPYAATARTDGKLFTPASRVSTLQSSSK